jgi:hypothetical protein
VRLPLFQAFPFSRTLGEVVLHPPSLASMFIYSSRGKWPSSLLLWSFPPTATFQSFSLLVAGRVPPLLVYLRFCEGFPLPPFMALRVHHPLCYLSFLLLLFIIQLFFLFFFPGWGSVCPGGYGDVAQRCLWEYHVPLSSPFGLHLSKLSVSWCLVAWEPSWFLRLTSSGYAMPGLVVWRSQSFASSWWFFL